jgi:hypothetical protein
MALRITKIGLKAIDIDDEAMVALKATITRSSSAQELETPAPQALGSRRPTSVAAQNPARKKHHPGQGGEDQRGVAAGKPP